MFPSPFGVFFICTVRWLAASTRLVMFPSPFGVFFICTEKGVGIMITATLFPSPFGVFFICTRLIIRVTNQMLKFPSPFGVFFICTIGRWTLKTELRVSVPFRGFLYLYECGRNETKERKSFRPLSGFSLFVPCLSWCSCCNRLRRDLRRKKF